MKKLIPIVLLTLVFISSCKEDDETPDTTKTETTAEKIQHTWNITSSMDFNFVGASTTLDYIDTLVIGSNGTIEFRADNKAYEHTNGERDTIDYQIVNDQTINFGGDVFTINTLNATEFKFTYAERTDTPYFDNVLILNR